MIGQKYKWKHDKSVNITKHEQLIRSNVRVYLYYFILRKRTFLDEVKREVKS